MAEKKEEKKTAEEVCVSGKIERTLCERGTFSIRILSTKAFIPYPNGKKGRRFAIKGNFIPPNDCTVELKGVWDSTPRNGKYTLVVHEAKEIRRNGKAAVTNYLQSFKGIGRDTATAIYKKYGDNVYDVLDRNIEALKEFPNFGPKRFSEFQNDYLSRGAGREAYAYFQKFRVPNKRIAQIFGLYRQNAVSMAKKSPFALCVSGLLTFKEAEAISKEEGLTRLHSDHIEASIIEVLRQVQSRGDTYATWKPQPERNKKGLLVELINLLGLDSLDRASQVEFGKKAQAVMLNMKDSTLNIERTKGGDAKIYWMDTKKCEYGAAGKIMHLLLREVPQRDYSADIEASEEKLGVRLSEEQRSAVQMVLTSAFSIVTGGPGTGKTTFQQVLLDVYKKYHPKDTIRLGAPTGRAARRMTESAGYPANTLHQILNLTASDEGGATAQSSVRIEDGLMLVDEASMLDIFLCKQLVDALSEKTQIVLIGDIYQLPSVGPGSVLRDLIDCGRVPVVKFTKIFRQEEGSIIAKNAMKMNCGETDLEFGDSFLFIEKKGEDEIVKAVTEEYKKAVEEFGIDEVAVLTPFRKSTKSGVNLLNPVLREVVNPIPKNATGYNRMNGTPFYLNDRVMYLKNKDNLTNGDIGYIRAIRNAQGIQIAETDFGDGRAELLTSSDMDDLTLAYATTIHKSQGSEYQCCIIVMDPKHRALHSRSIVYTATTRTKKKTIFIGSKKSLQYAITHNGDAAMRNSSLCALLSGERFEKK